MTITLSSVVRNLPCWRPPQLPHILSQEPPPSVAEEGDLQAKARAKVEVRGWRTWTQRQDRVHGLQQIRIQELQARMQALDDSKKDVVQMVLTGEPAVLFDVFDLLEDPDRLRVPAGGNLHWCSCRNCREMNTDLETLLSANPRELCQQHGSHRFTFLMR